MELSLSGPVVSDPVNVESFETLFILNNCLKYILPGLFALVLIVLIARIIKHRKGKEDKDKTRLINVLIAGLLVVIVIAWVVIFQIVNIIK